MFKFRASRDGLSLRFVGKTVIDAWGCGAGGGEALLGGEAKYRTPIPLVKVRADGRLYGSISYVFTPTAAAHRAPQGDGHRAARRVGQDRDDHVAPDLHLQ